MDKANRRYKIVGTITGNIWMPYEECQKEFDTGWFTFTDADSYCPPRLGTRPNHDTGEYPDYRTVLLAITNDGDFRSCVICEALLVVQDSVYRRTKEYTFPLTGKVDKYNSDCFVSE